MFISAPNRGTNGSGLWNVEDVFKLHTLGRTSVLRETRPLEEVNEAFDDVLPARNKAPRVVLPV